MFQYQGPLEISKSWMNRALILQSFESRIHIDGASTASDVLYLKKALQDLQAGHYSFDAGLGGTTFRFLAFRVSREVGSFLIRANEKLLARPQTELVGILTQLGVQATLVPEGLRISSEGWKKPAKSIKVSGEESSQFLSGLLLSAVGLDFDLAISVQDQIVSEGYLKYTIDMLKRAGMVIQKSGSSIKVIRGQRLSQDPLVGEIDVSSAFALIAASVLGGESTIQNWNEKSLQPDMQFVEFFKTMHIAFTEKNNQFKVQMQKSFKPLCAKLQDCPDLFPVLAVLNAFSEGESYLYGAPQLKHKESNRIKKTHELLSRCGFHVQALDDGMKISGNPNAHYKAKDVIHFDPEHDHRMAMAAALLILKGFPIKITEPGVITKSFPQFYKLIGLDL